MAAFFEHKYNFRRWWLLFDELSLASPSSYGSTSRWPRLLGKVVQPSWIWQKMFLITQIEKKIIHPTKTPDVSQSTFTVRKTNRIRCIGGAIKNRSQWGTCFHDRCALPWILYFPDCLTVDIQCSKNRPLNAPFETKQRPTIERQTV